MTMTFRVYHSLPGDAAYVRKTVFVDEQGFREEFDEEDNSCIHIVAYSEKKEPVATCRIIEDGTGIYKLGRLAVIREYRGRNLGAEMLREAEKIILAEGGRTIRLHAQCRVKDFYGKLGYSDSGPEDEDEGCPHIWMEKNIEKEMNI